MFLRWNGSGSRRTDDGKFRSRQKMGVQDGGGGSHRNWTYHLVSHQTGTSVKRTVVHVEVRDPHDNHIASLRDFSSTEQAVAGARQWIDDRLHLINRLNTGKSVGKIPPVPPQEK